MVQRTDARRGSRYPAVTVAKYTITSIDNTSIGAGGRSVKRGEFDDADEAIACAQQLVSKALLEHLADASDAHDLMKRYMTHGREVPMIYGEPRVSFHAYQYARQKAEEWFREGQGASQDP